MTGTQRGSLIGGIWLIAIGSVFLIQQAFDLPWARAWPLFLVMAVTAVLGMAFPPVAALGACTSMTLRLYAERKELPLGLVEVRLRHDKIHAKDCEDCETREGKIDRIEMRYYCISLKPFM